MVVSIKVIKDSWAKAWSTYERTRLAYEGRIAGIRSAVLRRNQRRALQECGGCWRGVSLTLDLPMCKRMRRHKKTGYKDVNSMFWRSVAGSSVRVGLAVHWHACHIWLYEMTHICKDGSRWHICQWSPYIQGLSAGLYHKVWHGRMRNHAHRRAIEGSLYLLRRSYTWCLGTFAWPCHGRTRNAWSLVFDRIYGRLVS